MCKPRSRWMNNTVAYFIPLHIWRNINFNNIEKVNMHRSIQTPTIFIFFIFIFIVKLLKRRKFCHCCFNEEEIQNFHDFSSCCNKFLSYPHLNLLLLVLGIEQIHSGLFLLFILIHNYWFYSFGLVFVVVIDIGFDNILGWFELYMIVECIIWIIVMLIRFT